MRYLFIVIWFLLSISIMAQNNGALPGKRAHHALVYDENSKTVLLTGGSTPLDGGNSFKIYNDLWSFDGNKWRLLGNAGDERSSFSLAYDNKRKKMYSFGGYTSEGSRPEFRVLENNNWKNLPEIPGLKAAEAGFIYDSYRDRLITFGGSSAPKQLNSETWEWDGAAWKKFDGTNPEPRQAFSMAYDEKRKKTLLFGGLSATPGAIYSDTWEYDGMSWKKVSEAGPGPRASAGFTYDSDKGLFILFGGLSKDGFKNDTWSYDGREWKLLSAEGPQARAMGYLAYDKERKRILLFGGRLGWPNDANDTWEWDGIRWTELKF